MSKSVFYCFFVCYLFVGKNLTNYRCDDFHLQLLGGREFDLTKYLFIPSFIYLFIYLFICKKLLKPHKKASIARNSFFFHSEGNIQGYKQEHGILGDITKDYINAPLQNRRPVTFFINESSKRRGKS